MRKIAKSFFWKKCRLSRHLIRKVLIANKIKASDTILVSFPKSGRTWLCLLIGKVLSYKYGKDIGIELLQIPKKNTEAHKIASIHGLSSPLISRFNFRTLKFRNVYENSDKAVINKALKHKKIIFLIRDPRDVIVSFYFELNRRKKIYKGTISEFIKDGFALKGIVHYYNLWYKEMQSRPDDFLFIRYEDMYHDTFKELSKVLDFIGIKASEQIINKSVEFCSAKNMRKMEEENRFKHHVLKPGIKGDNESYKVRKAKIGGYVDYLSKDEIRIINEYLEKNLAKGLMF